MTFLTSRKETFASISCIYRTSMELTVRNMIDADARDFLEVHHTAVRGIARHDYSAEVIDAWAPLPITEAHVKYVVSNPEGEARFIAECQNKIVGIGCLTIKDNELKACYVLPGFTRTGVGTALINAIESRAREAGLETIWAHSSLTAEGFYRSLGYEVLGRDEHFLGNGFSMDCIKIEKRFTKRLP